MTKEDPAVSIALFGAELLARNCPDLAAGQLCIALETSLCRAAHASQEDVERLHRALKALCTDFLKGAEK